MRNTALCGLVLWLLSAPAGSICSAQQYQSFRQAMAAAAPHLRSKDYAASRAPLEAALALAKTDEERTQVYGALRPAYRLLPDIEKMTETHDFLAKTADSTAERALNARDYASFLHQRGQVDGAVTRYEARLAKDENDIAALVLLPELYRRQKPGEEARGAELEKRLKALNVKLAGQKAEKLQQRALIQPATAAWSYKDAALAWLEAGATENARAAAELSLEATPEERNPILTFQWREGLGDIFTAVKDHASAAREYEKAVAAAPPGLLQKNAAEKLSKAKLALDKK